MKFIQYLNEEKTTLDELTSVLEKDCKPFLDVIHGHGVLWRGSKTVSLPIGDIFAYKKIETRTNRLPRNTDQNVHDYADIAFEKKFGWRARSAGVFASSSKLQARLYGFTYMVFPIGNFKYIFSRTISDFFADLPLWYRRNAEAKMKSAVDEMVDTYTSTGLETILNAKKYLEVIVKCDSYYLVDELACNSEEFLKFLGLKERPK